MSMTLHGLSDFYGNIADNIQAKMIYSLVLIYMTAMPAGQLVLKRWLLLSIFLDRHYCWNDPMDNRGMR